MSQSSWLVGGVLPGIERQPRKKLEPSPERLLAVLHRWRDEAVRAGRNITRIALAFEAGRDGFWLARWLAVHEVEAHVIHPSSVAVSRDRRRAKPTLRKAAAHLAALHPGGLAAAAECRSRTGEPLCSRRLAPLSLDLAGDQAEPRDVALRQRLEEAPERGPHAMVRRLARVVRIGIETADMLVNEGAVTANA
jgi:hypothetical protein